MTDNPPGSNPPRAAELRRVESRPANMSTALYRRFDAGGRLLYVGVTNWPYDRAVTHGAKSLWLPFAASGTTSWYATRMEAEQAEKAAIRDELPLFNRYHSAPGARERLIAYLTTADRTDLVEVVSAWKWAYREPWRHRVNPTKPST